MNSSRNLKSWLKSINTPDDLMPPEDEDLDWLFADPSCAEVLSWMMENVTKDNIVTKGQQRQFALLSEQGRILSGHQLEQALDALQLNEDDMTEEELDLQIRSLRESSSLLTMKERRLQQMSNDLQQVVEQTKKKNVGFRICLESHNQEMKHAVRKCERMYGTLQDTMNEVKQTINSLHAVYLRSSRDDASTSQIPALLCQSDFEEVFNAEMKYTEALAEFTDKKFFDGLASMTGDKDESYYQLVNMSDPSLLPLVSESEETLQDLCLELHRLQSSHSISLTRNIEAHLSHQMAEAGVQAASDCVQSIEELSSLSTEQLQNRLERLKGRLAMYKRELSSAKDMDLKSLIEQTTLMKEVYILTGDYNLKIARQKYFLDCQQQVIDKLVTQRSRHEMINLMLEMEKDQIQEMRHLLATITVYLQKLLTDTKSRLSVLEDAELTGQQYDRSVVDSRDVLLTAIHSLLDFDDEKKKTKVFTSYQEIAEDAEQFSRDSNRRKQLSNTPDRLASRMKEAMKECCDELGISTGNTSSLTPKVVANSVESLQRQLSLLEANIKTIMSTINQKKQPLSDVLSTLSTNSADAPDVDTY